VNRKYLIGGLIILIVGALITWIARNSYWEEYDTWTEPKGEARTNPFYAAEHLIGLLGAHAEVRHDIVSLPPPDAVIVLGHWNWSIIPQRRDRLERWVNSGGRLVASTTFMKDAQFKSWSGVDIASGSSPKAGHVNSQKSSSPKLTPGDHPDLHWAACIPTDTHINSHKPPSWTVTDVNFNPQVVRIPIGKGSVTMTNEPGPPAGDLLCGDMAQLFSATLQLRHGDQVIFLTERDGASLLSLTWQYGSPVVVLLGLLIILWLWRSGVRFGPLIAVPDPARRSLAEQVRGTGQFVARFGGGHSLHAATVRALNEAAARRVPQYNSLSEESRVTTLSPSTGYAPAELTAALNPAVSHNSQELRKAITILELARRHMTQKTPQAGS
jgi:hypothetical protein